MIRNILLLEVRNFKEKEMKVVIISNIPSPYRVDFFQYLQDMEYDVFIIYAAKHVKNRKWKINTEKLGKTYFLKSVGLYLKKSDRNIFFSYGIINILKQLKPDVVIGMEYNPTVLQAAWYCDLKWIPYVSWTDGTSISEGNLNILQKWSRRYIIHMARAYIASSTKAKELQLSYGADKDKSFISYLTVDTSEIDKYQEREVIKRHNQMICVGSLIPRKGIDLLFNALKYVTADYHLVLIGEGEERKRLSVQARKLGIAERITFTGFLDKEELYQWYAESELFILTTREDCFALVILEALAFGLPVICSKFADGVYDLVEDGENGIVIDPYQAKQTAEAIDTMLKSDELKNRMTRKSKLKLEKFTFEACAKCVWDAVFCALEEKK